LSSRTEFGRVGMIRQTAASSDILVYPKRRRANMPYFFGRLTKAMFQTTV
jgi:hypothetical protein